MPKSEIGQNHNVGYVTYPKSLFSMNLIIGESLKKFSAILKDENGGWMDGWMDLTNGTYIISRLSIIS